MSYAAYPCSAASEAQQERLRPSMSVVWPSGCASLAHAAEGAAARAAERDEAGTATSLSQVFAELHLEPTRTSRFRLSLALRSATDHRPQPCAPTAAPPSTPRRCGGKSPRKTRSSLHHLPGAGRSPLGEPAAAPVTIRQVRKRLLSYRTPALGDGGTARARSTRAQYDPTHPPPYPPPSEAVPPTPVSILEMLHDSHADGGGACATYSAQRAPPPLSRRRAHAVGSHDTAAGVPRLLFPPSPVQPKRRMRLASLFRASPPPTVRIHPSPDPLTTVDSQFQRNADFSSLPSPRLPVLLEYEQARALRNRQRFQSLATLTQQPPPTLLSGSDAQPHRRPTQEEEDQDVYGVPTPPRPGDGEAHRRGLQRLRQLRAERDMARRELIDCPTPGDCGGIL
ncbi:hypothetical protein ACQY0O_007889 [Thecaphora frezii]